MQILLDTNGLTVKKRNNAFWIVAKEGQRLISPKRVTSIAVTADCLLSASAIRLAASEGIPIYFFNRAGKADAKLWGSNFGSIATIRREQTLFALKPEATAWVIGLFELKAEHQIQVLRFLIQKKKKSQLELRIRQGIEQIEAGIAELKKYREQPIKDCRSYMLGGEGQMAKVYWKLVSDSLPRAYQFPARSRRPALDMFNAMLNYQYGMLYNSIGKATLAAGLDPTLGVLHTDGYQRLSFTFDLIEPFRPWIDQRLVEACLDGSVSSAFFEEKNGGLWLNQAGRRWAIPTFNALMEERRRFQHKHLSSANHMYRFAGTFAQQLLNNPTSDEDILDLL